MCVGCVRYYIHMENQTQIVTPEATPPSNSSFNETSPHKDSHMMWLMTAVLVTVFLFVAVVAGMYLFTRKNPQSKTDIGLSPTPIATGVVPSAVACTLEAKVCPDGSSVGRTGPNCEFAACPTSISDLPSVTASPTEPLKEPIVIPSNWKKQTVTYQNHTFSLSTPPSYKFYEDNANLVIKQQYPADAVVTTNDPGPDTLTFVDALFDRYDGSSRRVFFKKFLDGDLEGMNAGAPKSVIVSLNEFPLTGNSYLKMVEKNDYGNPYPVYYITVKKNVFIVLQTQVNESSVLQQNIDKIMESLEVIK